MTKFCKILALKENPLETMICQKRLLEKNQMKVVEKLLLLRKKDLAKCWPKYRKSKSKLKSTCGNQKNLPFLESEFSSFRSIDSGSNTPLPFGVGGGGGDDAESSGGFSIHSLSKMAAVQRQARVIIAAAAMGSQIATMDELTKNWVTGAPTSIQFLGKSCKVLSKK